MIIASVDDPQPRGVVDAFDVAGGARTRLWDTGPETSAWRVAPDGLSVAYLSALREPTEIERLVVRSLDVDARERIAAAAEASEARLAGFAWSADGRSIAAIRQIGFPGSAPAEDARWELVRFDVPAEDGGDATVGDDVGQAIWSVPSTEAEGVALALAAWDSRAERAAVIESGLDGGPAVALRLVHTGHGRELGRRSIDPGGEGFQSSPDGRRLAWTNVGDGAVSVLDLDIETDWIGSGRIELLGAPGAAGMSRDSLVWSPGGRRLAWREEAPLASGSSTGEEAETGALSAAESRVVVWEIDGGGERHSHGLPATDLQPGRGLRPLAFSPDGAWLLVAAGDPGEIEPTELFVVEPMGAAAPRSLGWRAPVGRWGVDWLP